MAPRTPHRRRTLAIGEVVADKYRIERLLGAGGMAEVYAAVNVRTDRRVALKWILPALAASPEVLARFRREALAAGRINHPNVVTIFDVVEHQGSACLVMELLAGETLAERMKRDGPDGVRRGGGDHAARHARRRGGARSRRHPPRSQARQHLPVHGRGRFDPRLQGARLRRIEADRRRRGDDRRHHAVGQRRRHARIHGARAGARRQARRSPHRHLFAGRRVLRDARGAAAVRGRALLRADAGHHAARSAAAAHACARTFRAAWPASFTGRWRAISTAATPTCRRTSWRWRPSAGTS